MAMSNGESNAVNCLLRYLTGEPSNGIPVPSREGAEEALQLLLKGSYKTLMAGRRPDEAGEALDLIDKRLVTADEGFYGHCDTCGATCDANGCTGSQMHPAALDIDDPRQPGSPGNLLRRACSVSIFETHGRHWLLISGEMFGPFNTADQALDAIPGALRRMK